MQRGSQAHRKSIRAAWTTRLLTRGQRRDRPAVPCSSTPAKPCPVPAGTGSAAVSVAIPAGNTLAANAEAGLPRGHSNRSLIRDGRTDA